MNRRFYYWVDILGMRYLGIDYGTKRMGIAVSDDGGRIAFPKSVVHAETERVRIREILRIAKRERIKTIVFGLPRDMSGKERETARRIRAFLVRLRRKTSLPIMFENEVLTTRLAAKSTSSKAKIDAVAAALILQSYLDRKSEARNSKFKTRVQNF